MTLTVPVSSSRVTKTVPLAVSGRWRCVTRPLARASRPCDSRRGPRPGLGSVFERDESGYLAEWRTLLGLAPAAATYGGTDPWLASRRTRILSCIPASGEDLSGLIGRLQGEVAAS